MADEIRRRRLHDITASDADRDQDGLPQTTEDILATETVFPPSGIVPQISPIRRTSKRTTSLSSTKSDGSSIYDYDEYYSLLPDEEDAKLNWIQRTRKSLKGDFSSICLLLFLYLLQGVPLGLIAAIPLVLSSKNASYGQQAVFSFAYWPFSLKLLWAPIVDSVYWKRLGRRKSWTVPCQYLIGIFMLLLSYKVADIMGADNEDSKAPNVVFLMLVFLPLNFLAATQDIAVDGWALTILSRKNVGYASTCNAVGQTAGYFLGNVVYLTLDSADFANRFFRTEPKPYGLVSLAGFVFFWGWVFLITTTVVLIFKKEVDHSATPSSSTEESNDELKMGIVETYTILWKIMRLKPMLWMLVVLLTGKFAFAATDGMTGLKLIGMGMPKDKLSSMMVFLTPMQILLPWMIGKWTAGPRPLNVFLLAYPYRIFMGGIFAALVWWTPSFREEEGDYPLILYAIWIVGYCFHQVATYSMFVSMMAFNAQISDPKIGGTYMTLLNTLNNLGGNWPVTLILSLTDYFTFKDCVAKGTKTVLYTCNTKVLAEQCKAGGDVCEMAVDGYYIAVALCSVVGLIWYKVLFGKIKYFQKIPRKDWSVVKK